MKTNNIRQIVFTGVFAAIIFVTTFALHVPAGLNGGYIHVGDAIIYLAACILPRPFAFAASAVGAGLSDLFSPGAAVWILPTVIIKPLCCIGFTNNDRFLCGRNIAALFLAGIITAAGYGAWTIVLTGSIAVALAEIPLFLIQSAASAICFVIFSAAIDKAGFKNIIGLRGERQ